MNKIIDAFSKLSKTKKIVTLILLVVFVLILSMSIPTLARFKHRVSMIGIPTWDGSVASSYDSGTGTSLDPYIINDGSELAYLASELATKDYNGKYFELGADIKLNDGIFDYSDTDGILYILDSTTYYVDEYTNKYYDNTARSGAEIGTINIFNSLDGFMGTLDGSSYTIYGLYITNNTDDKLALFTNLKGNINNIYIENAFVYGGIITGGIASDTTGASITNVLFDGYIIGKSTLTNDSADYTPSIDPITVLVTEETANMLTNNDMHIGSEIISSTLTGSYVIEGSDEIDTTITVNGSAVSGGTFNIDMGTTIVDSVDVTTITTEAIETVTVTFSNLNYNVVYKYGVSGGIVASSNTTTLENVINKAYVYGYSDAAGLIGNTTSALNINQSYNTGDIDSGVNAGGLVGVVENSSENSTITKSYNDGILSGTYTGGLSSIINDNTGSVTYSYSFNTSSSDYLINTISDTTVNVNNTYYISGASTVNSGSVTGSFSSTTLTNLQDETYVNTNLLYDSFIDFTDLETNSDNAWVYEKDMLPILFVDDITNPLGTINLSVYSWNNLSYDLDSYKFGTNITFSIEEFNELNPIKESYYYLSNSSTPLTSSEIAAISSWNSYSTPVEISTEGYYVLYAKLVDYDDDIFYVNSDLLILDLSGSSISITLDSDEWTDLRSSLEDVYIDRNKTVEIDASDSLSGVDTIKYYVTNSILNSAELDALSAESWATYSSGVSISSVGTYVVYAKVTDNVGYVTYANSDYIVFDGYTEGSIIIGRNSSSYSGEEPYITDKSSVTLSYTFTDLSASELTSHTHNFMTNELLPIYTNITLIDNINDKVYKYQIPTSDDNYGYATNGYATYEFTLFNEVGTNSTLKYYAENTYYDSGTISENFDIILDFNNAIITSDYTNLYGYIDLRNSSNESVRPTLYSTIDTFNVYKTSDASLTLSTTYGGAPIIFNSNSTTDIEITSGINYDTSSSIDIIDTTYEDMDMGLLLTLEDSIGTVIDNEYLKNFIFKMGTDIYYPEGDNTVHINLGNGPGDITKTLTIETSENNSDLEDGTYYFKISNYASSDGYYYDVLGTSELSIPVTVSDDNPNIVYSFDVLMDDDDRIINKSESSVNVSFNILEAGELDSPDIRVSLYEKDLLTAYDQGYTLVDLASYVSDSLTSASANVYYVTTNPVEYGSPDYLYNSFSLNLTTANFSNTSYKYVFELYDGTKRIGTIEKIFIVK